ncbi:hypothetical protein V2J09_012668 [Rumex salicifolius]
MINPYDILFLCFTFILVPLAASNNVPPLESLIYGGCSPTRYPANSQFSSNLNSLLTSLVNSATYSPFNHFSIMSPSQNDVVHGLYQCRGDLSMPDCASCVARSTAQMGAMCPSSYGAALQLQGCYVKYDNAAFVGVEDKTVVYKKFGQSVGYDGLEVAARDSVLGGLVKGAGNGPFRVVGSKDVRGVAQCVGDLSVGQCQDCVATAVNLVKSQCGTASYGDMFLGKCYARFNVGGSSGGYSSSGSGGFAKSLRVKTFAFVVGLLAGVVLLVILFTFICRTFAGSSK